MRSRVPVALAAAITVLAASGCGAAPQPGGPVSLGVVRLLAPADTKGGWHRTAEVLAKAMKAAGVASDVKVDVLPGQSGTKGLAAFIAEDRGPTSLLMTGMVMVGGAVQFAKEAELRQVTPIAGLMAEGSAIFVRADSSIKRVQDLGVEWKQHGKKFRVTGGGPLSDNHIAALLMADEIGIDPKAVNYSANNGGGEALINQVLNGEAQVGITGIDEIAALAAAGDAEGRRDQIRVLAVTSETAVQHKVDQIRLATPLRQAGIPVVWTNWRGVVGPPGLSAAQRDLLAGAIEKARATEVWQNAMNDKQWIPVGDGPEQLQARLDRELAAIKQIKAKLDA